MNCRKFESLFSALLEDELSQEERRALEAHMLACRRCAEAIPELRATLAAVHDLPSVTPSAFFEDDVMDRIRTGEGLRPSVIEWIGERLRATSLRPLFLTGAAACAVWIGVLLVGPNRTAVIPFGPIAVEEGRSVPSTEAPSAAVPAGEEIALESAPKAEEPPPLASPSRDELKGGTSVLAASGPSVRAKQAQPREAASGPSTVTTWAEGDLIPLFGLEDTTRLGRDPEYIDEYIVDQFYLERGSVTGSGSSTPIVPVSGSASDDVYITF